MQVLLEKRNKTDGGECGWRKRERGEMQRRKTYSGKQEPVRRNCNSGERWDSSAETCIGNMKQKDNTHGETIKKTDM